MSPSPRKLSNNHEAQLDSQRQWVAGHFDDPALYSDTSNKLRVVSTILENNWIAKEETVKLQCLGVALGDALAETLDLTWVTFDEGEESWPGLRYSSTSLFVHPVTMISKRVEENRDFDTIELFRKIANEIERLKDKVD